MVAAEITWPAKPKIFIILPFSEKKFADLLFRIIKQLRTWRKFFLRKRN